MLCPMGSTLSHRNDVLHSDYGAGSRGSNSFRMYPPLVCMHVYGVSQDQKRLPVSFHYFYFSSFSVKVKLCRASLRWQVLIKYDLRWSRDPSCSNPVATRIPTLQITRPIERLGQAAPKMAQGCSCRHVVSSPHVGGPADWILTYHAQAMTRPSQEQGMNDGLLLGHSGSDQQLAA